MQNFSFEKEENKVPNKNNESEPFYNINQDLILSGSHIKNPNTFELSQEFSILDKTAIGKMNHNRTISIIKFPSNHHRIESVIKPEEIFH